MDGIMHWTPSFTSPARRLRLPLISLMTTMMSATAAHAQAPYAIASPDTPPPALLAAPSTGRAAEGQADGGAAPTVNAPLSINSPTEGVPKVRPGTRAAANPSVPAPAGEPLEQGGAAPSTAELSPTSATAPPTAAATSSLSAPADRLPLGTPAPRAEERDGERATDSSLTSLFDPRQSGAARTIGALALVVTLAWLTIALLRRGRESLAGGRRPSGVIQVLARYPVGRGQQLLLLQVGRRVLCVHQASGVMRTLTEFDGRDDVADLLGRVEGREADGFNRLLRTATGALERGLPVPRTVAAGAPEANGVRRDASAALIETIDLTRRRTGLSQLLSGKGSR